MIDTVQFILFLVVFTLTLLLVVLGWQVFYILKELRKTISKANKVLDEAGTIAENVSAPISTLSSLSSTLKSGSFVTVLKLVRGFLGKDEDARDNERRKD